MATCRICYNNEIQYFYRIKEMMFGTNESFVYFLCDKCNCLQIESFPSEMEKYYANNYYSFQPNNSLVKKFTNQLAIWRDRGEVYNESIVGKILSKFIPTREEIRFISYLEGINRESRILDVGSGIGFHLNRLAALGFTNLRGIDPFLKQETLLFSNLTIFKKHLTEFEEGHFDLITLHHAFEHLPDPKQTLQIIYSKLASGGYCVIRTPNIASEAWEIYKENWFQIDAPRHFFIHSPDSLAYLSKPMGFKIEGAIYDSTPLQYYISEQYQNAIPLIRQKEMSKKIKREYERKTVIANKLCKGDQFIFILKK